MERSILFLDRSKEHSLLFPKKKRKEKIRAKCKRCEEKIFCSRSVSEVAETGITRRAISNINISSSLSRFSLSPPPLLILRRKSRLTDAAPNKSSTVQAGSSSNCRLRSKLWERTKKADEGCDSSSPLSLPMEEVRRNALAAVQLNPTTNSEINLSRGNVGRHSVAVVYSARNNAPRSLRGRKEEGSWLTISFASRTHASRNCVFCERKKGGGEGRERPCCQKSFYLIPPPRLINVHVLFVGCEDETMQQRVNK